MGMNKDIEFSKQFVKHYRKRIKQNKNLQKRFAKRLRLFKKDRQNPILRDHKLKGSKIGLRAFSITGDHRVVYKEFGNYILFLDIGTHNQVY